jgi:hypothetical protein
MGSRHLKGGDWSWLFPAVVDPSAMPGGQMRPKSDVLGHKTGESPCDRLILLQPSEFAWSLSARLTDSKVWSAMPQPV